MCNILLEDVQAVSRIVSSFASCLHPFRSPPILTTSSFSMSSSSSTGNEINSSYVHINDGNLSYPSSWTMPEWRSTTTWTTCTQGSLPQVQIRATKGVYPFPLRQSCARFQFAFSTTFAESKSPPLTTFVCHIGLYVIASFINHMHISTELFDDTFIEYLFDLVENTRHQSDDTFNYSVIKLIVSVLITSIRLRCQR